MQTLLQDLRYGVRLLLKNRGFAVIAVVTLSLGIGANTAIFSVVNAVLLRPLGYENEDRLVTFELFTDRNPQLISLVSPVDLNDCHSQSEAFEDAAVVLRTQRRVTRGESPENVAGVAASPNLFELLGVKPLIGRLFQTEDGRADSEPVVVLSHSYWLDQMGADPQAIGKQLTISGKVRTVIGVLPADFKGIFNRIDWKTKLWTPDGLLVPEAFGRRMRQHVALSHLKPGVSVTQAQREIETISERLAHEYPDTNTGVHFTVQSLHESIVGSTRATLLILLAAVGFVLLIACANVANMLLARGVAREKEIAIRAALGAGRWRVMRQLLTESLLLSAVGGALATLLALWGVDAMRSTIAGVPRAEQIHLDWRVLGFTLALSLLTGIVFGLLPAWQAAKLNLTDTLKDIGRRAPAGRRSRVLRQLLVVAQVALSLVLLLSAGLMLNSLNRLLRVDPGFKTENLLCVPLELPRVKPDEARTMSNPLAPIVERVNSLPGIQAAAIVSPLPLSTPFGHYVRIEGSPAAQPGEQLTVGYASVSAGYFSLLDVRLTRGRLLTERDTIDALPVVVINETMARTYWPDEEALGRRIVRKDKEEKAFEVVGVVSDTRQDLTRQASPQLFYSYLQVPTPGAYLMARASSAPLSLANALREAVQASDRRLVVGTVQTMEQTMEGYFVNPRFYAALFSIFGAVALLLTLVGIYGVQSYAVTQRIHEIGVRMALGARGRDVMTLIISQGMLTTGIGLVIGLGAALALTRLLTKLVSLYGVGATDATTFAVIAGLFAAAALLACYVPARRAANLEPMVALRHE